MQISSDSSESSSDNEAEFRRIYQKQLLKREAALQGNGDRAKIRISSNQTKLESKRKCRPSSDDERSQGGSRSRSRSRDRNKRRKEKSDSKERDNGYSMPVEIKWFIYDKCPKIDLTNRTSKMILELPIFKKKEEILNAIIKNQFVLVTGETGCGKSTQVPRLIYEYLRSINNDSAKIMCVQPRRLAVINLHQILEKQMPDKRMIGYQIGMKSFI
jgi:flagellar biosynthesis GTPase FlhF